MTTFYSNKDCPYSNICKNKMEDCHLMCLDFHNMNLLFEFANIPKRYIKPFLLYPGDNDYETYEILSNIKNNIHEVVQKGDSLYIFSEIKQNGKTSWAIKILQNYFHLIKDQYGSKKRGIYIDINDYLLTLKANFNDYSNEEIKEMEKDIDKVDIVIWDNISEKKLSEWERTNILQHIKKRLSNNLCNIFVGNKINRELVYNVGEDLAYYIQDNSVLLPLYSERGGK